MMYGVDPALIIQGAGMALQTGTQAGAAAGGRRTQEYAVRSGQVLSERESLRDRILAARALLQQQRQAALSSALEPTTQLLIERRKQQTLRLTAGFVAIGLLFWMATRK